MSCFGLVILVRGIYGMSCDKTLKAYPSEIIGHLITVRKHAERNPREIQVKRNTTKSLEKFIPNPDFNLSDWKWWVHVPIYCFHGVVEVIEKGVSCSWILIEGTNFNLIFIVSTNWKHVVSLSMMQSLCCWQFCYLNMQNLGLIRFGSTLPGIDSW